MLKRLKYLSIALLAPVIMMATAAVPVQAFSLFNNNTVCSGANADSSVCQQAKSQGKKNPVISIIRTATSIIALLSGLLALFMITISGFTYITSAGSTEAATNSRKRIVNSIIGLVLVGLAWTIVRLVTDRIIQ